MSPLTEPTKLTLRKSWQPMDPDAAAYIAAVETADGQALEEKVKIAIDNFVLGCKADGIWDAIKASCILAGARTLSGALVPLAGAAPTNFNFVSGDYNRKTGLVGDGSTKYLDSGRLGNADPSGNMHFSTYSTNQTVTLIGTSNTWGTLFLRGDGAWRIQSSVTSPQPATPGAFFGCTRIVGQDKSRARTNGVEAEQARSPDAVSSETITLFRFVQTNLIPAYSASRLAFYSIGESLDLALLDARVTDLINKFAEVIP